MTVARWQRWLFALQLVLMLAWLVGWARLGAGWLVLAVASLPVLARLVLALQFGLAAAAAAPPRPPPGRWLRAWWHEGAWAARVFGWWQPFFSNDIPDAPRAAQSGRGVVLVHGFGCNRGFWTPWLLRLAGEGRAFVAVNLEPPLAPIDDHASAIDAAVQEVESTTGMPPIIIAHSMGGLAVRAWLRAAPGADARVHRVVTLATPHQGTRAARLGLWRNARQMVPGSDWLRDLAAQESPERRARFVCWHSDCDNVVYPRGAALLDGAEAHELQGLGHVQLAFDDRVMDACLALLR